MDHTDNNEFIQQEQEQEVTSFVLQEEQPVEPVEEETVAPEKKKKNGKRILAGILAAVLFMGIGAGVASLCCYGRLAAQEKRTEQLLTILNQQIQELKEELDSKSFTGNGNSISGTDNVGIDGGMTPAQVYAKTADSVVAITTQIAMTEGSTVTTAVSFGSGFILTTDGYVVTNHHVIEGATSVTVTTGDGKEYPAVIRGYDSTNDIAVLKIQGENLPAVKLGSSSELIVGDQVAVIGNPLGELTSTLTVGYVSAKDRIITTDGSQINMIQTDASVNSGNSGGPIFNMKGEVVGIITAKYSGLSASGASIEGIGFAIPMDDVLSKINDLKDYGYITGAYLGVLVQDMDRSVAEYYGLPLGAYVAGVTEGFCAEKAGLQAKDIIIGLGEYSVVGLNSLTSALQNFKAGDTTTITVWRSGLELELEITLDEKPH